MRVRTAATGRTLKAPGWGRPGAGLALAAGLATSALALAGAALADPSLKIEHAVARVTVIPEDRTDVQVTVTRTNAHYPLRIHQEGEETVVDGDIGFGSPHCMSHFGRQMVGVFGRPAISLDDMPQIVVRTPKKAVVRAGGAVFGTIGRGAGADLANAGCGDWTVANQNGPLRAVLAGSGDLRAGDATAVTLVVSGSADTRLRTAHQGLEANVAGSGDVRADEVDGPLTAHVDGSGDVRVRNGAVSAMTVAVAGSGDVIFGGTAQSLDAHVAGSGDVHAGHVTGEVKKSVAGSGDVTVGD